MALSFALATFFIAALTAQAQTPAPQLSADLSHSPGWVVISVDDIQASMKKVADAGGKVLGDPMDIPGIGRYVSFTDTEGNRVSMLQPLPRMTTRPQSK